MRAIYKYTLRPGKQSLKLPIGSKIISVANQRDDICIWAEVETLNSDTEERDIEVFATGDVMYELYDDFERVHIGTVLLFGGDLVLHVYEIVKVEGEK